jgi:hypothetical protein
MATSTHYFTGLALYPRLAKTDDYGNFTIGVELDATSKAEFENSGITVKPRTYEGKTFVTFRRPQQKLIKDELVKFGPPSVMDNTGQPLTKLLGNGSKVTVKVIVYDSMKGKGHRLEAVKVDELIEFVPQPKDQPAPAAAAAAAAPGAARPAIPF